MTAPENVFGTKEWIEENELRTPFLDFLFDLDGREDPGHPHHATYTGLMEKYWRMAPEELERLAAERLR